MDQFDAFMGDDYLQIAATAVEAARGGNSAAIIAAAKSFDFSLRLILDRTAGEDEELRVLISACEQLVTADSSAARDTPQPPGNPSRCLLYFGHYLIEAAYRTDRADTLRLCLDRAGAGGALLVPQSTTAAEEFVRAAGHGAAACMAELARRGADPRMGAPRGGEDTPLVAACKNRGPRGALAVAWLCDRGANVNGRAGDFSHTPLMVASAYCKPACVKELLLRGADPTLLDSDGRPALYFAVETSDDDVAIRSFIPEDKAECIELLLAYARAGGAPALRGECLGNFCRATGAGAQRAHGLIPRIVAAAAGAPVRGRWRLLLGARDRCGDTLLHTASRAGVLHAVRALCALGADVTARKDGPVWPGQRALQDDRNPSQQTPLHTVLAPGLEAVHLLDVGLAGDQLPGEVYAACADELIERAGGGEAALLAAEDGKGRTPLAAGLKMYPWGDPVFDPVGIRPAAALVLARWPLGAPFPAEWDRDWELLPAAVEEAERRVEVLWRWGQAEEQEALAAAFLRHVRDACGGAVAPAHAPFARFRFVEGGGLERAWAVEREVHRFPAERVALCRAALEVATHADVAAQGLCVPLLREVAPVVAGGPRRVGSAGREAEKQRYAAARAAGRWGEIRAARLKAEADLRAAEAAWAAAVFEAEAQLERLRQAGGAAA